MDVKKTAAADRRLWIKRDVTGVEYEGPAWSELSADDRKWLADKLGGSGHERSILEQIKRKKKAQKP